MRGRVQALLEGVSGRLVGRHVSRAETEAPWSMVVAFSGGVDSSLVAWLVEHAVRGRPPASSACTPQPQPSPSLPSFTPPSFSTSTSPSGSTNCSDVRAIAALGVSPSLSREQRWQAHSVAEHIGIELREVFTKEGKEEEYISNLGRSCYVCKTHLYSTLSAIHDSFEGHALLFNGTNQDDLADPTRVGLQAAREFGVVSPLEGMTKQEVRDMAKHVGLPNWNAAASPCLRSRLATGVRALPEHLERIETAEAQVRALLSAHLHPEHNLRVRHLPDNVGMIQVDSDLQPIVEAHAASLATLLQNLGFASVRFDVYRVGSVAARPTIDR